VTTALVGGRYELGAVVGTGGMAQVRRATDTVLGRDVAVKIFREDLDEESAARARTEMQTLAALTHPNLVAVHDAGTWGDSQPYLVMELVEGPTLAACCLDGSLTRERIADIGAGLADALAYVHSQGVVHRDVKPANVLVSPSGAKLADFGIARIVDGVRHTGTGLTVGTAPYLSPEQVTGEAVGPAADVYALGLVLLECLTGNREYTGGPVETALARLHRQPEIPADLPAPWPTLLRAMTARKASHRPSASDVAQALRGGTIGMTDVGAVEPETAITRVMGAPTRVARVLPQDSPARRRRPSAATRAKAAWAVVAVLLIAVLTAAMSASGPAFPTPQAPTPVEQHIADLQDAVAR
jgi:serine/threonine protein kinase